ncbi:MAG: hypothetical protein ACT4P5_20780 [Armatimonadota bacterium]
MVSAVRGDGLADVLRAIARSHPEPWIRGRLTIPYSDGRLLAHLHAEGRVVTERYSDTGVAVEVDVPGPLAVSPSGGGRVERSCW